MDQAGAVITGHATGTVLAGYGGGDRRLILAESDQRTIFNLRTGVDQLAAIRR